MSVDRRRVRAIHRRLVRHYGVLGPPRVTDPLDELIWTVLSQHTSDANAERAFLALRAAYPTWAQVVRAPSGHIADVIRSGGLANTKAPRIQAILRQIREREGRYDLGVLRSLDDRAARAYLASLPGVGPKTAAVVMAFALGRDTIPVDTHVHRVSARLGMIPPSVSAERAHDLLDALVPAELKTPMHMELIRLGREICKARSPMCGICPVRDVCPTGTANLTMGRVRAPGLGR